MNNTSNYSADPGRQDCCERPERDFPAVIPEPQEKRRPLTPDELDSLPPPDER